MEKTQCLQQYFKDLHQLNDKASFENLRLKGKKRQLSKLLNEIFLNKYIRSAVEF